MTTEAVVVTITTRDGYRRLHPALQKHRPKQADTGNALSLCLSEQPDLIIAEVHARWNPQDTSELRILLGEIRRRQKRGAKIVLFLSSPLSACHLGHLLFRDDHSLEASKSIDALILAPPLSSSEGESIEAQLNRLISQLVLNANDEQGAFPALGEPSWAPTLASRESIELWFHWLPRYAKYINESPLIVGETGTGKTLLAAAVHLLSGREGPFVSITPRDFSSPELVQAELFGAVAGAYTGAVDKWGLVKEAEGGTLFIDELQSIDVELQGKLITFIEDKKYRRVGAAEQQSADVRFVFATNKSLASLVEMGKLRDDFAYRLERLQLHLPPLRQRRLDILAGCCRCLSLIDRVRPHNENAVEGLTEEAYHLLFTAQWPGNIRQLESVIAQAVEHALIEKRNRISESNIRVALEQSLGGYQEPAQEVLTRAAQELIEQLRMNPQLGATQASSLFLIRARELALESTAGDSLKAAKLIDENAQLMQWVKESIR